MAISYNPSIVLSGLILSVDAANLKSYSGSGTIIRDLTTNNLNGTLINGPSYSSLNGGSIVLDGTNDYIDFTNSSTLNITTGDFALELVFYYERSSILYGRAACRGGLYLADGWQIYAGYNGSIDQTAFGFGKTAQEWADAGQAGVITISQNTWYHALATRLNGTLSYYINGQRLGSMVTSYNFNNTTNSTRIGLQAFAGEVFKGRISIFRQYNIGLNEQQVFQNFSAVRGRFGI